MNQLFQGLNAFDDSKGAAMMPHEKTFISRVRAVLNFSVIFGIKCLKNPKTAQTNINLINLGKKIPLIMRLAMFRISRTESPKDDDE